MKALLAVLLLASSAAAARDTPPVPVAFGADGTVQIIQAMADRAILLHMDSGATTPSQHALIQSFAQQPQTVVVVPVAPTF